MVFFRVFPTPPNGAPLRSPGAPAAAGRGAAEAVELGDGRGVRGGAAVDHQRQNEGAVGFFGGEEFGSVFFPVFFVFFCFFCKTKDR